MHKYLAPLALSAALATPAFAADNYTIDTRHTFPVFEISHLGFSTQHGRFDKTSGGWFLQHREIQNHDIQVGHVDF